MAEWPTLGALGEKIPADVIAVPAPRMTSVDLVHVPRNPARAPQGLEDAVYGMAIKPLSDIGMGIGSVVEGQGWNSPEASAGFLAAMGLLTPMKAGALAPRAGIKAYHGSPHDFDRFDISKIGTGEGAQAYGHGLYFAENPKTAQSYRDALTNPGAVVSTGTRTPGIFIEGKPFDPRNQRIIDIIQKSEGDPSRFVPELTKYAREGAGNPYAAADDAMAIVEAANRGQYSTGLPGKMYEVSIAAKLEQFLDWDRPLRQMSPEVQKTLNDAWLAHPEAHAGQTGEQIYRNNTPGFVSSGPYREPNHGRASEILRDAGIPGIRYLDQGSRTHAADIAQAESRVQRAQERLKVGAGDPANLERQLNEFQSQLDALRKGPTSNYVLFRDDIIDILRKYGIMAPAGGVALDQATQQQ